jgi:hypothetical protein
MKEFTDSERLPMEKAWEEHLADDSEMASFISFEAGFLAGLDHQQAECDSLKVLNQALTEKYDGAILQSAALALKCIAERDALRVEVMRLTALNVQLETEISYQ